MARGKIASLFIGLGANTVELDTKLGKSKKKVKAFSNDLATMGKAGAKAFAGLGLAGGAALTAIYKSTAPAIDEMGKLSRQTGVTVSELQSLRHAAELNGVASGYMDKALEKFVRQLGDAKKGIGAAKFMLDEMGLSADNLSKLGTSEAIKVIADEISHMGNEMDKSSAAAALFGRNGMAMVNMFDDGRMAIDAAAKELDAYGLKLSEIDVGKVEASNDAWERIGALMKNAGQIITVELSPYIEAIAKYFLTAAKQAGGFRSVTVNAMEGVIWSIGLVADSIQGLKLVWHGVSLASQAVYTSMIAWVRDWDNAITTIIDKVPGYTAKASSSINKLYVEAATAYSEANLKFLQLTNAPTASNVLKNSLDEVKATAEVAIDELAQMRAKKKAAEVSTAQLDFSSQLDQDIENYNYTEEAFRQHMAVMAEIKNPGTEEDIENYSYRLDQERAFQSQLNDIVSTGLHSRNEFESASFKSQFQSVAGNLAAVTAQAAQHDKKMFKINKAANIIIR